MKGTGDEAAKSRVKRETSEPQSGGESVTPESPLNRGHRAFRSVAPGRPSGDSESRRGTRHHLGDSAPFQGTGHGFRGHRAQRGAPGVFGVVLAARRKGLGTLMGAAWNLCLSPQPPLRVHCRGGPSRGAHLQRPAPCHQPHPGTALLAQDPGPRTSTGGSVLPPAPRSAPGPHAWRLLGAQHQAC